MDQDMNEENVPVCPNCGSCHCGGCAGDTPAVPAADAAADCDGEQKPAPSYEEVRAAYDRLAELVEAYGERAMLQLVIDDGEGKDMFLHAANDAVSVSDGKKTDMLNWCGARGNMLRANRCFEHDADAVGEGIKCLLRAMRKEEEHPIAALLGMMSGKNC